MFSGIVEGLGRVVAIRPSGSNIEIEVACPFAPELKVDQSLAHNGVCLTVTSVDRSRSTYRVTAIQETLDRSNLGLLKPGDEVNLERSMRFDGRLDGHIVQGHVDTTARCTSIEDCDGSRYFRFEYDADPAMAAQGYVTVEKGSVTVNGVSLTVCDSGVAGFRVAIIPYTMEHTNFHAIGVGTTVNLEFDIVGKYIARLTRQAES